MSTLRGKKDLFFTKQDAIAVITGALIFAAAFAFGFAFGCWF